MWLNSIAVTIIICTLNSQVIRHHTSVTPRHIEVTGNQAWGHDGQILAKFLF